MSTLNDLIGLDLQAITDKQLRAHQVHTLRAEAATAARHLATGPDGQARSLTGAEATRFDQYATVAEHLDALGRQLDRDHDEQLALIRSAIDGTGDVQVIDEPQTRAGGPRTTSRQPQRDAAMRSLDAAVQGKRLAADGAEVVEQLMTRGPATDQTWVKRWAVAAGSEHYESAFAKVVRDADRGHLTWTPEEHDAYRQVDALAREQRAMAVGSGSTGGYMVPLTLDPAILLTSGGSTNPLRELARVVQTSGNQWAGVTSAGVTAEWKAEAAEVADASPTLAQPNIPVHAGDAFVPFSFEAEGDAVNLLAELNGLLVDAADQLTATAFTTGSGAGQPKGIITALLAAAGSKVDPTTAETIAASDIYKVQNALPPRWQTGAAWTARLDVINALRQFETGNGSLTFPGLQDAAPTLLGRTMHENSCMHGIPNPAVTAANVPLIYGDYSNGYVIVDRIGSTLELVPHLFGANGRPTGQRGALLWFRTGADIVNANAFRYLSVPTTA